MAAMCNSAGSGTNNCNKPFTIECLLHPTSYLGVLNAWFAMDTAAASDFVMYQTGGDETAYIAGGEIQWALAAPAPMMIDAVFDNATGLYFFKNGVYVYKTTNYPRLLAGSAGYFGYDGANLSRSYIGRWGGCVLYNDAETWQQIEARWIGTGLR